MYRGLVLFAQDAKMRPAGSRGFGRRLQRMLAAALGLVVVLIRGVCGLFPHRVHKSGEFVPAGEPGLAFQVQPDQFPSQRGGKPPGMTGAQIVTMRFRIGGERAENCGGVGVNVRQGSHCRLAAG